MSNELILCDGCSRHIRASDARCPFCEHAVTRPAVVAGGRSAAALFFAVAAAATVAACYGGARYQYRGPAQSQGSEAPVPSSDDPDGGTITQGSIGVARMLADRTIELQLRAEDGRGAIGEGLFRYVPEHPQYGQVLAHLGPMQPGDHRAVRPF